MIATIGKYFFLKNSLSQVKSIGERGGISNREERAQWKEEPQKERYPQEVISKLRPAQNIAGNMYKSLDTRENLMYEQENPNSKLKSRTARTS